MSKSKIDPITLEVVRGGLTSLCAEMGIAMERSAYSPIFSEGLDYSYAMFDGKTDMITQAAFDPMPSWGNAIFCEIVDQRNRAR